MWKCDKREKVLNIENKEKEGGRQKKWMGVGKSRLKNKACRRA